MMIGEAIHDDTFKALLSQYAVREGFKPPHRFRKA
ncbi:hypothetical protein FBY02_103214 [Pseudomonas sp. SJZ078]|nr:hypothetical protein FBY02_103214 [Pseudomonas sp. SJZ078]